MISTTVLKQVVKPSRYVPIEINPYTFTNESNPIGLLNVGSFESSYNQINFQIIYGLFAESKVFRPYRFFIPEQNFIQLTKDADAFEIESLDQQKHLKDFEYLLCYLNNDDAINRFIYFLKSYRLKHKCIVIQSSYVIHPLLKEHAEAILICDDLFKLKSFMKESNSSDDFFKKIIASTDDKIFDLNQESGFGSITKFLEPIITVRSNDNFFNYIYTAYEKQSSDLFEGKSASHFSMMLQAQKRLNDKVKNKPNENEIFMFPLGISYRIRHYLNVQSTYKDVVSSVKKALASGWRTVHLFFWIGHPLESTQDKRDFKKELQAIEDHIVDFKKINVHVHFSVYVPSADSSFLWDELLNAANYEKEIASLASFFENKSDMFVHYEDFTAYFNRLIALRGDSEVSERLDKIINQSIEENSDVNDLLKEWSRTEEKAAALFDPQAFDREFTSIYNLTSEKSETLRQERQELSKRLAEEKLDQSSDYNLIQIKKALPNLNIEVKKSMDAAAIVLGESEMTYGRSEKRRASQQQDFAKKYRIKHSKQGKMIFYSYLDIRNLFIRMFEQAKLPIVMTKGYTPHPKIAFVSPASMAVSSEAEYFDVEINTIQNVDIKTQLNQILPDGIQILDVKEVSLKEKTLSKQININEYHFDLADSGLTSDIVKKWSEQKTIEVERETKSARIQLDIKLFLDELKEINNHEISMKLITLDDRMIKTEEILASLNQFHPNRMYEININRLGQYIRNGSDFIAPLDL